MTQRANKNDKKIKYPLDPHTRGDGFGDIVRIVVKKEEEEEEEKKNIVNITNKSFADNAIQKSGKNSFFSFTIYIATSTLFPREERVPTHIILDRTPSEGSSCNNFARHKPINSHTKTTSRCHCAISRIRPKRVFSDRPKYNK